MDTSPHYAISLAKIFHPLQLLFLAISLLVEVPPNRQVVEYVLGNDSRAWRAEDYDTLCKKHRTSFGTTPYMITKEWFYTNHSEIGK